MSGIKGDGMACLRRQAMPGKRRKKMGETVAGQLDEIHQHFLSEYSPLPSSGEPREVDYLVVQETSVHSLVDRVRRLMNKGWRPQGGVSTLNFGTDTSSILYYFQAMVR